MGQVSRHAAYRIQQHALTDDELARALAGRAYRQANGYTLHYDPSSRCAAVINPQTGALVTAYRLMKKQVKRHYSR